MVLFTGGDSAKRFKKVYGENWRIECDTKTGRVRRLFGGYSPLDEKLTLKTIERATRKFLLDNKDLLEIDLADVVVRKATFDPPFNSKTKDNTWYVSYQQHYKGIPVYGGFVKMVIMDGGVVSVKSSYYPGIDISTRPKFDNKSSLAVVQKDLKTKNSIRAKEASLVIYPVKKDDVVTYHLCWMIDLLPMKGVAGEWLYFVDAHNNEVICMCNTLKDAGVYGRITGDIYVSDPGSTPDKTEVLIEDMEVSGTYQAGELFFITGQDVTDENGLYNLGTLDLTGKSVNGNTVYSFRGPHVVASLYNPDAPASINPFVYTKPLDTSSFNPPYNWKIPLGITDDDMRIKISPVKGKALNAFYHVNRAYDFFTQGGTFNIPKIEDNPWAIKKPTISMPSPGGPITGPWGEIAVENKYGITLEDVTFELEYMPWFLAYILGLNDYFLTPYPMIVQVNCDDDMCNGPACAGTTGIYLEKETSGYRDAALCADVIYHEYTHRILASIYDPTSCQISNNGDG
jgi:hypothetical protein